jgi:ribonuclease P protein component
MTIVKRNLLKRRLRELTRVHLLPTAQSQDVLIRARAVAYDASVDALRSDIRDIATRLTGRRGPSAGVGA